MPTMQVEAHSSATSAGPSAQVASAGNSEANSAGSIRSGTVRSFKPEIQDLIERRMGEIVAGIAATFEMTATLRYERRYPATVNSPEETQHALGAATALVGAANVDTDPMPSMASEDFAFMLQEKAGCYVWLGAGRGPGTPGLHNPHYDFNDEALAIGASYWVTLAEQQLAA